MATPSKLSKYVDGFLGYAYVVIPKYKNKTVQVQSSNEVLQ
jgi:hypothetical protein